MISLNRRFEFFSHRNGPRDPSTIIENHFFSNAREVVPTYLDLFNTTLLHQTHLSFINPTMEWFVFRVDRNNGF
jgi:hypothetical protein